MGAWARNIRKNNNSISEENARKTQTSACVHRMKIPPRRSAPMRREKPVRCCEAPCAFPYRQPQPGTASESEAALSFCSAPRSRRKLGQVSADVYFRFDMLIEYFTGILLKATVCRIRAYLFFSLVQ